MIRHILPFALCCLTVALPTWAQENSSSRKIAARVAPLNGQNAIGIAHVDLSKVDVSAATAWAVQVASLDDRENIEAMAKKVQKLTTELKAAGAREIEVVFYMPRAIDHSYLPIDVAVVVTTGPYKSKAVADVIRPLLPKPPSWTPAPPFYDAQEQGDAVIVALSDRLKSLVMDAKPSEAVVAAFDATKPAPIRIIAQLPNDLRRVIRETFPKLPDELGGLTGSDVADGFRWATLSIDLPPLFELNIEAKTTSGEVSKSLAKFIDGGAKMLGKMAADVHELSETRGIWEKITPRVDGDKVVISIGGKPGDREAFQSAAAKYLLTYRRRELHAEHNFRLRQLGLAMHNFLSDRDGHFPARAILDVEGKPLLSWRVELLPYLGHIDLYSQFRLSEPWDSEHNKKLIEKMPAEFESPLVEIEKGKTPFVAPISDRSIFSVKKAVRVSDIVDGTSNTILLATADAQHAVVWTKPDDLVIDPKDPPSGLHFNAYDGRKLVYFTFADGNVLGIPRDRLVNDLLLLLTMNEGVPVEAQTADTVSGLR